jgi:hypothetical protein
VSVVPDRRAALIVEAESAVAAVMKASGVKSYSSLAKRLQMKESMIPHTR